jgi:tripartite-type tricarboxylate transporter receptor subunit TctC
LITWLKANPNKASAGVGNIGVRLLAAFFQKETETQFTVVPYRGLPAAVQDLAGGQIDLFWGTPDLLSLKRFPSDLNRRDSLGVRNG